MPMSKRSATEARTFRRQRIALFYSLSSLVCEASWHWSQTFMNQS